MSGDQVPGDRARALLRAADRAALATGLVRPLGIAGEGGWPYASLALTALDAACRPLLLISTLADHTQNLLADGRASLLYDATHGLDDPLAGARLTVLGRAARCDDPAARARYLARHPAAEAYAGFGDFSLWRMEPEAAHLVAGFGRIAWIPWAELSGAPTPPALADAEAEIVDHMNADHADAVALYAALLGAPPGPWRMTGVDAEGADLRLGGRVARLPFDRPVADAEGARVELVRLVKRARAAAG